MLLPSAKKTHQSLQNSFSQLEKKDAKKSEFFLAASHQLKSPVAIIQWCLQSVMESTSIDKKDRELVHKALTQSNAMSQLITDMLHVFRLVNREAKRQEYVSVDLNALIAEVIVQYEVAAHKQGVHVVKDSLEVLPPVYADIPFLRQALVNLLDNAIKYSPSGSKVSISGKVAKDHFVEVCITDQGIGIPEAEQVQLFSEFFRGEEARQVTHEGTGLGLVLVKHIVEEFGGHITVKSELHKGSSFTMRLPVGR